MPRKIQLTSHQILLFLFILSASLLVFTACSEDDSDNNGDEEYEYIQSGIEIDSIYNDNRYVTIHWENTGDLSLENFCVVRSDEAGINEDNPFYYETHGSAVSFKDTLATITDTVYYAVVGFTGENHTGQAYISDEVYFVPSLLLSATPEGDESLRLTWTRSIAQDFVRYNVYAQTLKIVNSFASEMRIAQIEDINDTTFLIEHQYLAPETRYFIRTVKGEEFEYDYSNMITIVDESTFFHYIDPYDAVIDRSNGFVYLVDYYYEQLVALDYLNENTVAEVDLPGVPGFIATDVYAGNVEIYQPLDNGKLQIYNSADVSLIEEYDLGVPLSGVAGLVDGKLYVSLLDHPDSHIWVIDRATGDVIDSAGVSLDEASLLRLSSDKRFLVSMEVNCYFGEISMFSLDENGLFDGNINQNIHEGTGSQWSALELEPNNNYMILGNSADRYTMNENMEELESIIRYGHDYIDFLFDDTGENLFCASNEREIFRYVNPNLEPDLSYPCNGFPRFMWWVDGQILTISCSNFTDDSFLSSFVAFEWINVE